MKANKSKLILISVAVLLIAGLGWFVWASTTEQSLEDPSDESIVASPDKTGAFKEENATESSGNPVSVEDTGKIAVTENIEYHFLGKVLSVETSIEGKLVSKVSQDDHQTYADDGLFNGYKGDVLLENRECKLRKNADYSFWVTYEVEKGVYTCKKANLVLY